MTREDIINNYIIPACERTWNEKICDEIKQALEQEPCEDCISRQAVLDAFGLSEKTRKYGGDHSGYDTLMLYEIQDIIEDLPSITPQPKIGRWKRISIDKYVQHAMAYYKCSECGEDIIGEHNYCPSCGIKMEVEE